jgi:hypothetical protein
MNFSSSKSGAAACAAAPFFVYERSRLMAFTVRNLSVLAYANGFTLWHYKATGDGLDEVARSDFFSGVDDMLAAGDIVMVSAVDGARILTIATDADQAVSTRALC